jgi:microcystin-dependent protein
MPGGTTFRHAGYFTHSKNERDDMEVFIGTIMPVGFNFAPRGWALCNGQLLSIAQNTALFSLLGTVYGGNGQTTFALPDLRGRTLVGMGQGPGMSNVQQGQVWGTESTTATVNGAAMVTIDAAHLPKHNHPVSVAGNQLTAISTLNATTATGGPTPVEGTALGSGGGGGPGSANIYVGGSVTPNVALNASSVTTKLGGQIDTATADNAGGGGAFPAPVSASGQVSVVQPSLGINYIIAIEGIYPARN